MHAVTHRSWPTWLAAFVVIVTPGCRGSRPFGSIVKVTHEAESGMPDIEPPQQRLATTTARTASTKTTSAESVTKKSASSPSAVDQTASNQSRQSSRRDQSIAKRGLSTLQPNSDQKSVATVEDVELPRGDAEELMVAFKDYPPEVQSEALRRLVATTARSAQRSGQPESLANKLSERLTDLPDLPETSPRDPNAVSPNRIASRNSLAADTTPKPSDSASLTHDHPEGQRVTDIEAAELAPVVSMTDRSEPASKVHPAVASSRRDDALVAQVNVEKELNDPSVEDSLEEHESEIETDVPPLSSSDLFEQLVRQLEVVPNDESEADRASRLIKLRHLMVLSGDPDGAVEQIDGMNETEQEYLRHQLLGLWTMIDPQGHPVSGRRFSTAIPQFREAAKFAAAATDTLEIRSIEFCTEIESYGQIEPFKNHRFEAGEQVILYCEVENFTATKSDEGYETHLQGSYDLYNENDQKVVSQLLPADRQVSANYLRDYFIAYQMHLPEQLSKGKYRLQLTMEDVNGKKYGQTSIDLEIKK